MPRPVATWTRADEVVLSTPYNARFVETLKVSVPGSWREWVPENKTWIVWGGYADEAVSIFLECFPSGQVVFNETSQQAAPPPPPPPAGDPDCRMLYVTDNAPIEVITAAWRALSKLHHPDMGGSTTAMQTINAAYERLKFKRKGAA